MTRNAIRTAVVPTAIVTWFIGLPMDVQAYIGPGLGVTGLGALVALLGALVFMIVGLVWYPAKRMYAALRGIVGKRHEA